MVSHIYLEPRYVGKLYQLAARADLLLVQPSRLAPHPPASITSTAAFTVATLRPVFPSGIRSSTRWVLPGLVQRIAAFQPDIIQVENELHSFVTIQALLARSTVAFQAKVVVAFWQNIPLRGWRRLLGQPLNKLALRQVDFFLPSNVAGQELLLREGVPREQLRVLPLCGIEPAWFSPWPDPALMRQHLGLPESHFIVGFSGRLVPEKGVTDLVAALRQLRAEGYPVHGLIVGQGPLAKRLIAEHPLVTVVSRSEFLEALRAMAAMDVLVLPSRSTPLWVEQFGRVLVEAMYAGIPVVGSSSGAIPEVIGDAGLVFPEGDTLALRDCLARLYVDPALREHFRAQGKARAERLYSHSVLADQVIQVYTQLVAGRR
ncbi:MAG: glycosyltransferase family 4 protein [Chloroflexi bacterium]|nr:glycosyltransferase family 4 protein [Chloroflexota bacterium]